MKGLRVKGSHSVHWGINPPSKTPPPSFLASLPLNLQIVQPPFLGNPPIYWFFVTPPPPLKLGFFRKPPKYYSFLSFSPSYLLKVTKFLLNFSQFEFLVTTEESVLVYIFVIKACVRYFFKT